jgi:hypothetical protein
MSNEAICFYCGTGVNDFIRDGKLGCRNCYEVILNFKEATALSQITYFANDSLHPTQDLESMLQFCIKFKIPIRFRLARNLKNQFYTKLENSNVYKKLEYFLEHDEVRKFTKFGKVYCFDEDHIRAEFFLSSSECEKNQFPPIFYDKNIFDYKDNFGYLTSCPTNSRKGNKVSALLDLSELTEDVKLNILNKYKENIIKKDNLNEKIIFFLKNYDKNILLVYINIVINIYNLKLKR